MLNPPVLQRVDTNIPIILFTLKQKLINDNLYNNSTCYIGVEPERNELTPSIDYCVLYPGKQGNLNWEIENQTMEGEIEIKLWHKNSVDIALRSDINLTQLSGITEVMNNIQTSLELFDLVSESRWILAEPLRLVNQSEIKTIENWSTCSLYYRIRYGYDPTLVSPIVTAGDEYTQEYSNEFV